MRWIVLCVAISVPSLLQAQEDTLSYAQQLEQLEMELDSLSIFSLFDSVLNVQRKSEMSARFVYTSGRLSAGRDFNLNQKGYSPGISYYHKSGAYLDFTSFFDNNSVPALTQSILHGGYMWLPSSKWVINPYVERTFNHQTIGYTLNQSIGAGVTYDFKLAEIGVDYALLWGKDIGHRLIPNVSKTIRWNNAPFVKTLNFYPGISLMAGTTTIFNYTYSDDQVDQYLTKVKTLTDEVIIYLRRTGQISTQQAIELREARRLLNSDDPELTQALKDLINILKEGSSFELLSVNFTLPVSFSIKQTSFIFSYSYSIPQKLSGEDFGVDPTGFFSFSVSRRITW